jgi:hypothetical protein
LSTVSGYHIQAQAEKILAKQFHKVSIGSSCY